MKMLKNNIEIEIDRNIQKYDVLLPGMCLSCSIIVLKKLKCYITVRILFELFNFLRFSCLMHKKQIIQIN